MLQIGPPAGDPFYLAPVLSYNSTDVATSTEIGNGWNHTFKRQVQLASTPGPPGPAHYPKVYTGAGQAYRTKPSSPTHWAM